MNRVVPFTKGAALGVQRLGGWIYFSRIKRGISQRELAIEIDVDRKTVLPGRTAREFHLLTQFAG